MKPKELKNYTNVVQVFGPGLAVYQYVIKENQHKPTQVIAKNFIHEALKSGRGVGEPKGHDQKFKVAVVSPESSFLYVAWVHSDLMIT